MGAEQTVILPKDASDRLHIMGEAARLAGQGLLDASRKLADLTITEKTAGDFVSNADLQAEKTISDHLNAHFAGYGWLGEETGTRPSAQDGLRWIVDPLDGTTNFLKGLPHWAVSIALYQGDRPLAAIIYDPAKSETFSAEAGQGAYLNGRKITVSKDVPLQSALFASGVPAGGRITYLPHCLEDLEKLMPQTAGLRRWGAAALDLAYVAAGRLDGYWERNLGAWDIAAGALIVQEAGGYITPLWPGQGMLESGSFIASNGALHGALAAGLNTGRA
ncbi:inositol monophosphatase [Yoonia sp. BS5-3]|uniref:Inositol-1-monophosphatase n=1 Tax=Yoonia phaeophyticola TaxID=3137369 RepID=A0ABZ3IE18_9RHOB